MSIDHLLSQFQLSLDKYIHNHNFVKINNFLAYNQWLGLSSPKMYRFYDYGSNPVMTSKVLYLDNKKISYDDGLTWDVIHQEQQLYGAYFFLANNMVNYQFNVYTIEQVAQSLGGIFAILLPIFKALGHYINS